MKRSAVMGQQSKQERAYYTTTQPWNGTFFLYSAMVLDVSLLTRTAWNLPAKKTNSQLHSDVLSSSLND